MKDKLSFWWYMNGDGILSFIKFIFICAFVVYALFGLGNLVMKQSCKDQARVMQVEYHFGFFEGCMFELEGNFIPADQYFLVKDLK